MRRTLLALCCVSLFAIPTDLLAERKDPLTGFLFGLKIDAGVGELGAGGAFFKSISGLSSESEVVDYQEGGVTGPIKKLPGRLKYGNITLKRGITADKSLAMWRKLVEDDQFQQARKNGSIALMDQSNKEVARWTLVNAWPSKISIETDEETGDLEEVIVLAVEGIRRQ